VRVMKYAKRLIKMVDGKIISDESQPYPHETSE
jgi:hypothetical protein